MSCAWLRQAPWSQSGHAQGQGQRAGLQPLWPSTGLERRQQACLPWKQHRFLLSPMEAARLPPGSRRMNAGPSHLPWKQHGSQWHAMVPTGSRRSDGQPTEHVIMRWATSVCVYTYIYIRCLNLEAETSASWGLYSNEDLCICVKRTEGQPTPC